MSPQAWHVWQESPEVRGGKALAKMTDDNAVPDDEKITDDENVADVDELLVEEVSIDGMCGVY